MGGRSKSSDFSQGSLRCISLIRFNSGSCQGSDRVRARLLLADVRHFTYMYKEMMCALAPLACCLDWCLDDSLVAAAKEPRNSKGRQ